MKNMIVALLATGLMGSAFAQSAPPAQQEPEVAPSSAPTAPFAYVPGAKSASEESLGEMKPYYIIGGVVVAGLVAAAAGGGGGKKSGGTTGTTK